MSEPGADDPPADDPPADEPAPATPAAPPRHRARTVVAAVLGVLTVLVVSVTIVAVWARATVLRPEPVGELVGDALAEPEVQTALATHIAEQIAAAVDLESALTNVLPSSLDQLAPVFASGANTVVERTLTRVLESPDVQQGLVILTERAHDAAMALLQGDGLMDGVTVSDGQVTLNTLPLVARGLTALQSIGLLQDVDVPELTFDGDPVEQRAELETALGRDLRDDFGQLVVYRSDSVARAEEAVQSAQRVLAISKRALVALLVASVLLIAATILVAPSRWRALLVLGLGTGAMMVVLRSAVRRIVDEAPDLVERAGARAAVDSILSGASVGLLRLAGVVGLLAVIAVLIALFARHWSRDDLALVASVVAGTIVFALLGFGVWSLVVGLVAGIALHVLIGLARSEPSGTSADTVPTPSPTTATT